MRGKFLGPKVLKFYLKFIAVPRVSFAITLTVTNKVESNKSISRFVDKIQIHFSIDVVVGIAVDSEESLLFVELATREKRASSGEAARRKKRRRQPEKIKGSLEQPHGMNCLHL